jgi:hypothetical protein
MTDGLTIAQVYTHHLDLKWMSGLEPIHLVRILHENYDVVRKDVNSLAQFLSCVGVFLQITKHNFNVLIIDTICKEILSTSACSEKEDIRHAAMQIFTFVSIRCGALFMDVFDMWIFVNMLEGDDDEDKYNAILVIWTLSHVKIHIAFINAMNTLIKLTYLRTPVLSDIALACLCGIIENMEPRLISDNIVTELCSFFKRSDNAALSNMIVISKSLSRLATIHHKTIFKVLPPENIQSVMLCNFQLQFTLLHTRMIMVMYELFNHKGTMRKYIYGRMGVYQLLATMRSFLEKAFYGTHEALKLYVLLLSHCLDVQEETPGLLLRILTWATDRYMHECIRPLFLLYSTRKDAFKVTMSVIGCLDIFKYCDCEDDDTCSEYTRFDDMCKSILYYEGIPTDGPYHMFTELESNAHHIENIDSFAPAVKIACLPNTLNLYEEKLFIHGCAMTLTILDFGVFEGKTSLQFWYAPVLIRDKNYYELARLPLFLQSLISKYVEDITQPMLFAWVFRRVMPDLYFDMFVCDDKILPLKWSIYDVLPPVRPRPYVKVAMHSTVMLNNGEPCEVFKFCHMLPKEFFEIPDCSCVMSGLSRFFVNTVGDDNVFNNYKRRFTLEMWGRLRSFDESVRCRSPAIEFIHRHPRWFDKSIRRFAFLMRNLSCNFAARIWFKFHNTLKFAAQNKDLNIFKIQRGDLYTWGSELLHYFGRCDVPIIFGCCGIMRHEPEFYTVFARELKKRLFEGDAAENLMPRQNVSLTDMTTLGLLFARVLYAESAVDIRLDPHFFYMLREDRDRDRDRDRERFYVNTEWETNVSAAFITGFNSVYVHPYDDIIFSQIGFTGLLALFSDVELVKLFAGKTDEQTREYLHGPYGVKACRGFTDESPQILMFRSILRGMTTEKCSMLLFKITGMSNIPIRTYPEAPGFLLCPRIYSDPDKHHVHCLIGQNILEIPLYTNAVVMEEYLEHFIAN